MTTLMAIDPSLKGFCCAVSVPGQAIGLYTSSSRSIGKEAAPVRRIRRYEDLVEQAVGFAMALQPKLVLVEGYSYGSQGRAVLDLAEMRAVLYTALLPHVGNLVEVPPALLKKFAAGKGNASKAQVVSALARRYGRAFESDDQADAFGLLQLGLVATGQQPAVTKVQAQVAETLKKLIGGTNG